MRLTPQQEALAPILKDHLASGDERALVIEGLSGVGKSTLVQRALAEMGRLATVVDESPYTQDVKIPSDHVAVVDYFHPNQIVGLRRAIGEQAHPMIVLAHPRFTSDRGLSRVDHVQNLEAVGVPSLIHRLAPMNDQEAAVYAGQKSDLIQEFGLGIGGHIRTLLNDPLLNEQRAMVLTTTKLHQILRHASEYHQDHVARAEALLGRTISQRLGAELEATKWDSLEKTLRHADPNLEPLLPRHPETLRVYQDILEFRASYCGGIDVFVPHVEPELVAELGLVDGYLGSQGRILKMAGSPMKAWMATRTEMDGGINDRRWVRRNFDEWIRGKTSEFTFLPGGTELPPAGENPLWVHAGTHGGFSRPDTPLFTYAAETLLQERGIPYSGFYAIRGGVAHHVTKDGVKVR